ncbi:MAG: toxin [Patescibacteria group bacterium]
MKYFDWNQEKNRQLKRGRGVSFEDVLVAISEDRLLAIKDNPQPKRYPKQKIFVVEIGSYAYLVPFVEDEEKVFLKTIIPSRKATKTYLFKGRVQDEIL